MQINWSDILKAIPAAGASAYALVALVVILIAGIVGTIWKSSIRKRGGSGASAERQHASALLGTVSIVGFVVLFVVIVVVIRESKPEPQPVPRQELVLPTVTQTPEPEPKPKTYDVNISSVPFGARIFVDKNDWGITPTTVKLPAGRHEVLLKMRGYEPLQDVLVVPEQLVYAPPLSPAR